MARTKDASPHIQITRADEARLVGVYETLLRLDSMAHVLGSAMHADGGGVHHQSQLDAIRATIRQASEALDTSGFNSMRSAADAGLSTSGVSNELRPQLTYALSLARTLTTTLQAKNPDALPDVLAVMENALVPALQSAEAAIDGSPSHG